MEQVRKTKAAVFTFSPPYEKQKQFLLARKKYVAYGGARGGGKSWILRIKAVLLCLEYPGLKLLLLRRTYPELLANHINVLREMLYGIAKYNATEKIFRFGNGASIKFGYCASEKDVQQFQGAEYDIVCVDEATHMAEEWLKKIFASCRGTNGLPKRIYLTCNPGGQGHGYIRRLFVDRQFKATEDPDEYEFIQAKVTDNLRLMEEQPDYINQLKALPPKLRDAWLEGRWDILEGMFFDDFYDNQEGYDTGINTHVINPIQIDRGWTIYRSFDWGYEKPFSVGWWAVDYDGVLYRILELYGMKKDSPNEGIRWTPEEVFKQIRQTELEHPYLRGRDVQGVADPSIWNKQTGVSIADTAAEYGVYFAKADNERVPGWMQVHKRFRFNEEGRPLMYIFRHCEHFIRTIPLLIHDPHRPEDLDSRLEDHIADEVRYMCMARPITPREPIEPIVVRGDPLDLMKGRKKGWTV